MTDMPWRENKYAAEGWDHPHAPPTNPAGVSTDPVAVPHAYMPDGETLGKVDAIAERLNAVAEQRKQLEDEEKFLRARLATLLPAGTTKAGKWSISVRENRRWDSNRAAQVLSPGELELCSVVNLSSSRAREMLAPARYAECQTVTGDPVVTVR